MFTAEPWRTSSKIRFLTPHERAQHRGAAFTERGGAFALLQTALPMSSACIAGARRIGSHIFGRCSIGGFPIRTPQCQSVRRGGRGRKGSCRGHGSQPRRLRLRIDGHIQSTSGVLPYLHCASHWTLHAIGALGCCSFGLAEREHCGADLGE